MINTVVVIHYDFKLCMMCVSTDFQFEITTSLVSDNITNNYCCTIETNFLYTVKRIILLL